MKGTQTLGDKGRLALTITSLVAYSVALPFVMGLINASLKGQVIITAFNDVYRFFVLAGLIFGMLFTVEAYVYLKRNDLTSDLKHLGVILLSVSVTYLFSVVFGNFISLYSMPLMLSGLLIAMLIDKRLALFSNIIIGITFFLCFITIDPTQSETQMIAAILTQAVSSSLMIIFMKKNYTRMSFIGNAVIIGICVAAPIAILSGLIRSGFSWVEVLTNGVWAFISILLSLALFMVILPILEKAFALYSDFRLEEMCSPEAKLIKRLIAEAPGTYNHSLAVGNLAQACAIKIGIEPALVKACAYYHDVGKLKNPLCFTENQSGYNPHDDFIPEVSVYMITDHAAYGYELIKKQKLPTIIADVAREHHGTTSVQYFLNKAKGITDEQLESEQFCYPGPKPQTRVAGLIMIVDTVEAATRSTGVDRDMKKFRDFIHRLVFSKVQADQFSECPLTFKDLQTIEDTLVETIPSLYHQRIKYDNKKG